MKTPATPHHQPPLPIDLAELEASLEKSYRRTWYAACALGGIFITLSAFAALN